MPTKKPTWIDTDLWKQLQQRAKKRSNLHEAAPEILPQVTLWMEKITTVLAKGHTSPQDFTLHDEDHAYRVAQRMWDLVPKAQRQHLSDYEVALLLLAAYLHDIGMCPSRQQVSNVHRYVLTKADGLLSPAEAVDLQHWLDNERDGLVPPLCTAAPTPADLALAEEITTYYVRHKHNDWSADWIREHLKENLHFLSDTQAVLIRLCQSHHWDHHRLQQDDFSPRPVGSVHPQRLHLRHLACLLRVADILENDPERVPPIIFQHRDIVSSPKSIIHWQIPHQLSLVITDDRVFLSAQPLAAAAHKAILSLADAIDAELAGCAAIAARQPFHHCPGLNDEKRDWPLAPACHRDVKPRDQRYEYIDGAFRPNTPKLLQLLSGTQLYDTPLAAVRELLQNAFDAVREKIARRRLQQDTPGDPKWETQLGNHEHVTLTLIQEPGGTLRLTCQDTGCGMTRAIIERHLLVSGDARRPAIIELERQCEAAGFRLGRTGQFGIGVLSYFMLAKSVSIQTCRLQDCGDLDAPGWAFTTTGVGDFGELRKLSAQPPTGAGTLIEWTLDPQQFPDTPKLATDLEKYLREQLVKIPCAFRFVTEIDTQRAIRIDFVTGWTHSHDDIIEMITAHWPDRKPPAQKWDATDDADTIAERRQFQEHLPEWLRHARSTLRLAESVIELPEGCGTARILLPWFDLPEGPALAYVLFDREIEGNTFTKELLLTPAAELRTAWRGIYAGVVASDKTYQHMNLVAGWMVYSFDRLPNTQLQVNRVALRLKSTLLDDCFKLVRSNLGLIANSLKKQTSRSSFYDLVNGSLLHRMTQLRGGQAYWIRRGKGVHFGPIGMPSVAILDDSYRTEQPTWRGKHVSNLVSDVQIRDGSNLLTYSVPDRILMGKCPEIKGGVEYYTPVAFWSGSSNNSAQRRCPEFPPHYDHVIGCLVEDEVVLCNEKNWAVQLVMHSKREWDFLMKAYARPEWEKAGQVQNAAEAALMLMLGCRQLTRDSWKNLNTSFPDLLPRLWRLCAKAIGQPVEQLRLTFLTRDLTYTITPQAYFVKYIEVGVASFNLPKITDPEWLIEFK